MIINGDRFLTLSLIDEAIWASFLIREGHSVHRIH